MTTGGGDLVDPTFPRPHQTRQVRYTSIFTILSNSSARYSLCVLASVLCCFVTLPLFLSDGRTINKIQGEQTDRNTHKKQVPRKGGNKKKTVPTAFVVLQKGPSEENLRAPSITIIILSLEDECARFWGAFGLSYFPYYSVPRVMSGPRKNKKFHKCFSGKSFTQK